MRARGNLCFKKPLEKYALSILILIATARVGLEGRDEGRTHHVLSRHVNPHDPLNILITDKTTEEAFNLFQQSTHWGWVFVLVAQQLGLLHRCGLTRSIA
jgi:hypothetical protein